MAVLGVVRVHARTVGQVLDDAAIVASIKAKIAADRLSNLWSIEVGSHESVVTLGGTVDTPEGAARPNRAARQRGQWCEERGEQHQGEWRVGGHRLKLVLELVLEQPIVDRRHDRRHGQRGVGESPARAPWRWPKTVASYA